ncbi:hypothetical protein TCE0_034f11164 [Talaromyces pinophilus]|uniref:Uncharacterized protein n=1 Tax=Talaromyces pinophilus TaxID=128442 RepID=A0A6V8HGZ2_TALPI|nr:hypothetical protein TCE0_034f11164 [Talaromyces pinophilus]
MAMLLERPVFRAPEEFVSCVEAPSSMEDYFKDDWYSGQPERLIMISDLKIVAPVISRRRGRCYEQVFVHYGYPNDEETIRTNGIRHDEIMKNLTPSVIEILSRIPRDYLRSFTSIDNMVGRMWLECIGVTIPPLYLKEKLETSVRLTDFKLLHFRITARHYGARDLLGELKAAGYSPDDGVITSGNSTERLRQTTPNGGPISTSLDCKEFICMKDLLQADPTSVDESLIAAGVQPATFRIMTHADEGLLDQIKGSREFLSACPVEAILDLYDDGYGTQESWFDPYTDGFRPYVPGVTGVGVEGFDDEDDHDDSFDSLEA